MNKLKALFLIVLLSAGISSNASAAEFNVNSIADAADANPGDGICATEAGGNVCTLRAAIQEANASAGNDTINIPLGTYSLAIAGEAEDASATGDLDITDAAGVIIQGAGAASTFVDGNGVDRVFHIQPGGVADISGITVQGGIAPLTYGDNVGGGILNFGGTLTITACMVSNNTASFGGGILNLGGTVTITDSTISGNTMIVEGGGIYNSSGDVTITNCTVSGNTSSGGFANYGGILNGNNMTIQNSTITGNSAYLYAGVENFGDMTMTNCTISNNTSTGNDYEVGCGGAGLHNETTITIQNSTIVDNTPVNISNGDDCVGYGGPFIIKNSIVASNDTANVNCVVPYIPIDGSSTKNLSTDATCGEYFTQKTVPEINLGPPAHNGGPTDTIALLTGSAAIDGGDDASCPATDQRGVLRPQGVHCDIGAFELEQGSPQEITITTPAPANAVYNTSFTVAANGGGSGNPVTYSSEGACTNVGATFTMTSGTGTCIVKYDQAGDGTYSPAPQVTQSTTALKAGQTIMVNQHAPESAAYNTIFTVAAAGGGSGNVVTISSSGACSGGGTGSADITMSGLTDTCTVFFDQDGNANYNQAPQVSETTTQYILTVTPSGAGSGSVSGNGIICSWDGTSSAGTCSFGFNYNAGFNLSASAGACSFFKEWGNACSGTGSQCSGAMTEQKAAAATFELYPLARVSPPAEGYDVITEAYNNIVGEVIQIQAHAFSEDLVFDHPVDVTIEAGWNCDYTLLDSVVGIKSLTVQSGSLTLQKGGFVISP
jgi:CSLREA domain-containing protein